MTGIDPPIPCTSDTLPLPIGSAIAIQANALTLPLADSSVDVIVTSPPYFALRKYTDGGSDAYEGQIGHEPTPGEFLEALWAVTAECGRVLRPSGSLFLNIMDKYNSAASNQNGLGKTLQGGSHETNRIGRGSTVDDVPNKSLIGIPWRYALGVLDGQAGDSPWRLRAELIWHKVNAMPDPTRDRAARKHEHIFHFVKRDKYFSDPPQVREFGGTVWSMPTEPSRFPPEFGPHPAPFPIDLPRRLIAGWSPEDGVVLDPFGGSGTTALVAKVMGRSAITVDLSAEYTRLAQWRIADRESIERVHRRYGWLGRR